MENQSTEASDVAKITREGMTPLFHNEKAINVPFVAYLTERKVGSLENLLDRPVRKRAQVQVRDHPSFIAYVARNKESGTILFADITEAGGSFTAIIDYHLPEVVLASLGAGAQWGEHSCKLVCEHTPEWKRWIAIHGKPMSQVELALFIEDNRLDILMPDGATMLEIVKSLEATAGTEFKSAVRLENGDRRFHYSHTTVAKAGQQGNLDIPDTFTLKLPVFANGPAYDVEARFRYTLSDGQLRMRIEIVRPHKVIELAMQEARNAIETALSLPVLLGTGAVTKI